MPPEVEVKDRSEGEVKIKNKVKGPALAKNGLERGTLHFVGALKFNFALKFSSTWG